jgi:DNA ligase 1
MFFIDAAIVFQQIEQETSRLVITQQLASLFERATPAQTSMLCYLSLGELNPPYKGTQFAIAEKNLIKTVAHLLKKDEKEVAKEAKKLGDIGLLLEQGNWKPKDRLSIPQVYQALCMIEEIQGTGSQEEKINYLSTLLAALDPLSAKYVARIVLGKLRLGFSDMTIIDALSWMVTGDKSLREPLEHAYNICADIGLIAKTLKEGGIQAITTMTIHIGIPIRPAAAERLPTAASVFEKLGPCVAQPKLDGFRLQVHIENTHDTPAIHFFSRNLLDMSYMFPDLTQALTQLKVKELICEGEAIVYDPQTGNFLPFQETVRRKRKHGIEEVVSELPLQFFVFDLLYVDGESYLDKPHEVRRKKLISLFKPLAHADIIHVIEEQEITSVKQLETYFTQNIAAGLEGLVVKRPDARYQPGKRNFNWIKLKRTEEGHLEDTIDCVILGYYAGKGKRTKFGLGALLVGVYNKKEDRFETIAKIGTGMTDVEWHELKKKCDAHRVKEQPHNVVCVKELQPDVWVSPDIVCSIRADEITLSPLHSAGKTHDKLGYALRFPRFMGFREDKTATDATEVQEIRRLHEDQFKK